MAESVTALYRPVGRKELELIRNLEFKAFPPRLPEQPFFYPVLSEEYAIQIARDWNTKDESSGYEGYVLTSRVRSSFLSRYKTHVVGSAVHREYWIPASDLGEMNQNIVGLIEITARFQGQ